MPANEQSRTILVKKPSLPVTSSSILSPEDKPHSYSCSYCSKFFSSPSHLSRHLLIHTGEKPCLCSECGQQFSQISSLERHQRTKHDKIKSSHSSSSSSSNTRLYQCTLCHEYFSLKHNLKMHEKKLHQIQTKFFCQICSAYFTCNSSLQKHRNFRHRSLTKISPSTSSDHWTVTSSDSVLNTSTEERREEFFSTDIFTNSHHSYQQQQVQYQILQCNEIN